MKAFDYAQRYKSNPTEYELGKIVIDMLVEVKTLVEVRHAKSNEAIVAILNEQIRKWKAFVKIVGDPTIRDEGLRDFILKDFPFIPQEELTA